jgi:chromosome segregation ATPase
VPLVGITGYVSYAPALVLRQLGGMQFVPRTMRITQFFDLFKDPIAQEVLEIIKQDWKHLVLVEIEGLKDPSASEGYARWRDLETSAMPCVGVKSPQTVEESIKRKRVNNEEELRRQVKKLRIELSKSRKDKAMLEGDKRRAFLDEQIQSRDARITKLELKLGEEKIAREESEKELGGMSLDWMQSCSELEAMEMDFNDCQRSAEYYQEKFAQVQFELMDRIGKYEDLNKKYMVLESRSTGFAKEESKRKGFEAVETELAVKKNEIKVMRIKLDKEREKVKYLDEKLAAMEKHKDQIDANNAVLNRTNMLLIEKMTKTDEQMDKAAAHAQIIRIMRKRWEGTSFAIAEA